MGLSGNFGGRPGDVLRLDSSSRLDEVRCKKGIDQSGFAKTGLTWKYKATSVKCCDQVLKRIRANVAADETCYAPTTITLNWKPRFRSLCSIWRVIAGNNRVSGLTQYERNSQSNPTYEDALILSGAEAETAAAAILGHVTRDLYQLDTRVPAESNSPDFTRLNMG